MVFVKMVNYIFTLPLYMFLGSSFFFFFPHLRELVPPLVAKGGHKNIVNKHAIDIIG